MRVRLALLVLLLAGSGCTGGAPPTPGRTPLPTPLPSAQPGPTATGNPLYLDVVAATGTSTAGSAAAAGDDSSYLDGMELAVQAVNAAGGVRGRPMTLRVTDDGGDPNAATTAIDGA